MPIIYNTTGTGLPATYKANFLDWLLRGYADKELANRINAQYAANLAQANAEQELLTKFAPQRLAEKVALEKALAVPNALSANLSAFGATQGSQGFPVSEEDLLNAPTALKEGFLANQRATVSGAKTKESAMNEAYANQSSPYMQALRTEALRAGLIEDEAKSHYGAERADVDIKDLEDVAKLEAKKRKFLDQQMSFEQDQFPVQADLNKANLARTQAGTEQTKAITDFYQNNPLARTVQVGPDLLSRSTGEVLATKPKTQQDIYNEKMATMRNITIDKNPTFQNLLTNSNINAPPQSVTQPKGSLTPTNTKTSSVTAPNGPLGQLGLSTEAKNGGVKPETIRTIVSNLAIYPGMIESLKKEIADFESKVNKK